MSGSGKQREKIRNGYTGAFRKVFTLSILRRSWGMRDSFFELGDVYVSGRVADFLECEDFSAFVMDSLKRFEKGDYGQISDCDRDENIENRCLFGIDRIFGRYGFHFPDCGRTEKDPFDEVICIRKHEENIWVTMDSEADWFLFLEDEQLKKIKEIRLPGG